MVPAYITWCLLPLPQKKENLNSVFKTVMTWKKEMSLWRLWNFSWLINWCLRKDMSLRELVSLNATGWLSVVIVSVFLIKWGRRINVTYFLLFYSNWMDIFMLWCHLLLYMWHHTVYSKVPECEYTVSTIFTRNCNSIRAVYLLNANWW